MPTTPADAPIAVIGGGLAGLTAALDLADAGRSVALFERRPYVGGKAYSFDDPKHGVRLDNGQHITMRCCSALQALLERIGCADIVRYQRGLEVAVVDPDSRGRQVSVLAASVPHLWSLLPNLPKRWGLPAPHLAPLHLTPSLLTYEHLSTAEKSKLPLALAPIKRMNVSQRQALDHQSFADWLRARDQSARVIERFWDLIILPTCNDRCVDVSAAQAIQVFQEGFSGDLAAADIGLFTRGLGEVAETALDRLRELGARVELGAHVHTLTVDDDEVSAVQFGRGQDLEVSAMVLALPPQQTQRLIPPDWRRREPFWRLNQHRVSPIVNVHMRWDRAVMRRDFVAVLDPDAQFIFNRSQIHGWLDTHWISVSLSGAHALIDLPQQAIVERVERAVRRALRRSADAQLLAARVVKESEATFRPMPGMHAHRLHPGTPIRNLALAGAWTATGWPATMESAVRSGHAAAANILGQ